MNQHIFLHLLVFHLDSFLEAIRSKHMAFLMKMDTYCKIIFQKEYVNKFSAEKMKYLSHHTHPYTHTHTPPHTHTCTHTSQEEYNFQLFANFISIHSIRLHFSAHFAMNFGVFFSHFNFSFCEYFMMIILPLLCPVL